MANIVITGASSGIGKALYDQFKLRKLTGEKEEVVGISRRGPDIVQDLRDELPDHPMVKDVLVLINCAGIMPLEELDSQEIFNVNFWGTYKMIWNLRPEFMKGCCVINIASVSGLKADVDTPIYAASKAAVISLTKSYAKWFAPHFRVNCISPGFYKTNLVPGEIPEHYISEIPMQYAEDPINLYPVIKMILDTKYLTGANIVVDGGVSL
jgi:NAD(P)-dependent dehydrogenase (short-subunit alcohol dehydrogenase family)